MLVRLASQKSADLVCLTAAHERGHALYMSALAIVRKAPGSVFIVPAGFEPSYKRILVPVDFSESARAALEQALAIAAFDSDVSLTVLHVYQVPIGASKTGQSYEEVAEVMRAAAERGWSEFSEPVNFGAIAWEIRYELSANAPDAIAEVAEEINAQLVVLASHGRTRPAGFLLGHVADCVCSQIARPVFCVKKKDEVVNLLRALRQLYDFE